jgi:HSP20 family protein
MALIRWNNDVYNPFSEFERLQDEINELFNYNKSPNTQGLFDRTVSPAIDVVENKDNFEVVCDLPGVRRDELDISVTQDVLTIKGEKKDKATEEGKEKKTFKKEIWEGNFQRTLSLPTTVDTSKVEAELKNGVLTISLPKKEEEKPKQISVKSK